MDLIKERALSFLCAFFIAVSGCTSLFFHPETRFADNPNLDTVKHEDVYFETSDGIRLHAWLLSPEGKNLGTVLYLHGNAENISTQTNNVLWLVARGFSIFAFDYRGYGASEGRATIEGLHLDAEAAIRTAIDISRDNGRIVVLGQSLGGAISVYAVAHSPLKNHVRALILDSAFSNYRDIAREKLAGFALTWPLQYPLSLLVSDSYSPDRWIRQVAPVPVVIIHGDRDTTVPLHHASSLYDEAVEPKDLWTAEGRGHIHAFGDKEIRERLVRYLKDHQ